jgi:hypothetical protein
MKRRPLADDWRPALTQIENPIADDHWEYVTPQGERRISRLIVGRPTHHPPARAWYCPVVIEGHTPSIDPVFGQGPVDALMNAMTVVKTFFEQNFSVVPGAKPAVKRKRPIAARRPQAKATKQGSLVGKSRQAIRRKPKGS